MKALKSGLDLLADASVIQTLAAVISAVLVLVPGVHVLSGGQVLVPLLAISALAQAVENRLRKRAAGNASA